MALVSVRSLMLPPTCPFDTYTGFYEPIRHNVNRLLGFSPTEQRPYTSVFAGAASGVIGGKQHICACTGRRRADRPLACLGNPLFLIKARLQVSQSQSVEMDVMADWSSTRRIRLPCPSARNTTTKMPGMHLRLSSGERGRGGSYAVLMQPCSGLQWVPRYVQV